MKEVIMILIFLRFYFRLRGPAIAGEIGDPGATLNKGTWALGPEISGVGREIRDRDNVRYDTDLEPPGHPLRYSLGGQILYMQTDSHGATAKWFEYDVWLGAFYKDSKNLTPYGTVIYSRVDGRLENFIPKPALDDFRSPTAAGIFFGVRWPMSPKTHLGIEARLLSENSATASLYYGF